MTHSTAVVFSSAFYVLSLNLRLTVEIRADASEVGHHCFAIGSPLGLGSNNSSGVGVVLYSTSLDYAHARSRCASYLSTTRSDVYCGEFLRLSPYSAKTKTSSFTNRDSINPTYHCRSCCRFDCDLTTEPPGTSPTPTTNHYLTSSWTLFRPIDS